MPNPENLELLLKDDKIWYQWRADNPNDIPNLRGAKLQNAQLSNYDLRAADFSGADLSNADLSYANLRQANLNGAILQKARLESADLREASFCDANLEDADLTRANLNYAVLHRANLIDANLRQTNIVNADLSSANLSNSSLGYTIFIMTDLSDTNFSNAWFSYTTLGQLDMSTAKGLNIARHGGPSVLSMDTVSISNAQIPDVFLRGCGVPEDFITYIPSLVNKPIEFYSCFISYSHTDKGFAHQLHDFLQGRGIRCWLDEHQLKPGHNVQDEIDRGIKMWDKVLLCASESSLNSWWVDREIERAFKKEENIWKNRRKKVLAIIPLDLDGYISNGWESSKAIDVNTRLAADFRGWQTDNTKMLKQFELVLKALRTDEGREEPPPSRL